MSVAAPIAGECGAHPGAKAAWPCQRCGTFVCAACERRTRPEAAPLCPKCWDLRANVVQEEPPDDRKRVKVGGLVLGALSVNPVFIIPSVIINVRELVKYGDAPRRWMNVVGLALSGLMVLAWTVFILFAATRG